MATRIETGMRVDDYYGNAGVVTAVEPPPANAQGCGTSIQVQWAGGTARTWLDAGDVAPENEAELEDAARDEQARAELKAGSTL